MTPADLARRLFRDQCNIGPNSSLEAYGETAAVAAMVPLIEALQGIMSAETYAVHVGYDTGSGGGNYVYADAVRLDDHAFVAARAALTPQPEEVA